MEKITIKNLIEFRKKSERSRKTLINNLNKERIATEESGGGDYWISCLSTIGNVFKYDNQDLLNEKIETLFEKINITDSKRIKTQFQRNIDILNNFEDFDFENIKPKTELSFLKKPKFKSIINIKGYPIQARPNHVFSFETDIENFLEIGSVWFVAKLNGFTRSELGMFTEILYRYLNKHYSDEYSINPYYVVAVDVYNGLEVRYEDILKGEVPMLIESTLDEISKL